MICSNCNQDVEEGALFCGNCGHPLTDHPANHKSDSKQPEYAYATPIQHRGEVMSIMSVVVGVIAIPASLVPIAGIALGVLGLVLGTVSRKYHHRVASIIGCIASIVAILVSLGVWTYAITHQKELSKYTNKPSGVSSSVTTASLVSTPCYNVQFGFTLNTDHDQYDGCDVRMFEASTIEQSNNVYKIYGNKVPAITEVNFESTVKDALEKDVKTTLPGFEIKGERIAQFAGSPAYIINASDSSNNIAVVEAAVLHKVGAGYNLFSIVHATRGDTTDLKDLEGAWQWK